MKFFVEPAIEIEKFELVDVITTSVDDQYVTPEFELDSLELPLELPEI